MVLVWFFLRIFYQGALKYYQKKRSVVNIFLCAQSIIIYVYVTKYALTQGVLRKKVRTLHSEEYVVVDTFEGYHKPFWHETREGAEKHAESVRIKKIASLKKQLDKMESLSF